MGIVQSDVLAFVFRVQTDPVLTASRGRRKMVFPLYNEEIHVLGRAGITDFDDLADRRVAIGREGSGTYLTARLLFKMSEVDARSEMVLIDTDEALAELKAGRIDAMFYVAGYPVKLFTEKVAEADGLALVPILNKTVPSSTRASEIPAKTYAWQPSAGAHRRDQGGTRVVRLPAAATATTSGGSPRPSRATWTGSSPTATRSGSRSISSTRCGAGSSTTASASTCGSPPPPRHRARSTETNPVMDAIKDMLSR